MIERNNLKPTRPTAPEDGRRDQGENPPNSMPDPKKPDTSGIEIIVHKTKKNYGKVAAILIGLIVLAIIILG